jgi:hypothetical protein
MNLATTRRMSSTERLAAVVTLALWPIGIAFGAVTLGILRGAPGYSLAGASAARAAAELVAPELC